MRLAYFEINIAILFSICTFKLFTLLMIFEESGAFLGSRFS